MTSERDDYHYTAIEDEVDENKSSQNSKVTEDPEQIPTKSENMKKNDEKDGQVPANDPKNANLSAKSESDPNSTQNTPKTPNYVEFEDVDINDERTPLSREFNSDSGTSSDSSRLLNPRKSESSPLTVVMPSENKPHQRRIPQNAPKKPTPDSIIPEMSQEQQDLTIMEDYKRRLYRLNALVCFLGLLHTIIFIGVFLGNSRNFLFNVRYLGTLKYLENGVMITTNFFQVCCGGLLIFVSLLPNLKSKHYLLVIALICLVLSAFISAGQLIFYTFVEWNTVRLFTVFNFFPIFYRVTFWSFSIFIFAFLISYHLGTIAAVYVSARYLSEIMRIKEANYELLDVV